MHNIATKYGIVNGSVGSKKDIIFMDGANPPNLSAYLIMYFSCYTGPNILIETDPEKK